MKNYIIKISLLMLALITLIGCEDERVIFGIEDGRTLAGFNGISNPKIIFNPSSNTESIITIGASAISSSDRAVQLTIDFGQTTLDTGLFLIDNLSPVIPAGQFTTNIIVTTTPSGSLPGATDVITLKLLSVEGAEIIDTSNDELAIGLDVQCPSVDLELLPGNYQVTASTFAGFFGETDFVREVIAGPEENQITILRGTYIAEGAEDLILTIDPDTGNITAVDETKIDSQVSFGPNTYKFLPGGRILSCVGIIEVNLDFGGSIAGNPHNFNLVKI